MESNLKIVEGDDEAFQLELILKEELITTYYQPIVSLQNAEIIGYEALSRGPEKTPLYSPLALIDCAKTHNRVWELEMLFRKKALERLHEIDNDKLLFINVDPDVIKAPEFKRGLTKEYLSSLGGEEKSTKMHSNKRCLKLL